MRLRNFVPAAWLLAACCAIGCSEDSATPKSTLSDQDKQQIEELDKQRAEEWKNKTGPSMK